MVTTVSDSALLDALHTYFKYDEFRPGQYEVLQCLLGGKDVLGVFPTGAGKSLTYQLAALLMEGTAIVVSPLIALMRDQVLDLQGRGIKGVAAINSTLTDQEVDEQLQDLAAGDGKLLYVTPERCSDPIFLEFIKKINVCLVVVDEAHCISEWGYDFRPAYLMLDKVIKAAGRPPVLALTATATPQVRLDIQGNLDLEDPRLIIHGFDRENLTFQVVSASTDREKDWQLLRFFGKAPSGMPDPGAVPKLDGSENLSAEMLAKIQYLDLRLEGPGLVYVATTSEAKRVSELLNDSGIKAGYYHGQMKKSDRDRVQQEWMDEVTPVVVATTAFGMGINKANLRYVVHYDLPASLEAYYQEAGRAGRDGDPARAILIYDPRDRNIQSFFIGGSVPSESNLRDLWDEIRKTLRAREREAGERVHSLTIVETAKIRNLPVARMRPLVAALEQAGGVAALTGNGDNQDVVTFRKTHVMGRRLLLDMKRLQARKQYEQSRLDMMLRYASTRDCRRKLLLGYFGEEYTKENCGGCDNCVRSLADMTENITKIGQPVMTAPAPDVPFRSGGMVSHKKWGTGMVQTIEPGTVTVHFPDVGYKTLALNLVIESGLLQPVQ